MTDQKQVALTKEQKYLDDIFAKFNADPEDPDLTETERTLLKKLSIVIKEVSELARQFNELDKEVSDRQEKMSTINQELLLKKGQSQGLVESLLALR